MAQILPFLVHYTKASGAQQVAATGLTVTVDIYSVRLSDGAVTHVVTAGSCFEIAKGGYGYILTGADLTTYSYFANAHTTDGSVQAQDIGAAWWDASTAALAAVVEVSAGAAPAFTLQDVLKQLLAAEVGQTSGQAAAGTGTVKNPGGTKSRAVGTLDGAGNRSVTAWDNS